MEFVAGSGRGCRAMRACVFSSIVTHLLMICRCVCLGVRDIEHARARARERERERERAGVFTKVAGP